MSLLIKALQKAEQEKTADDKTGASSGGLSLELTPVNPIPEPSQVSEDPDMGDSDLNNEAGFTSSRTAPTSPAPPIQSRQQASQQAAATMFAAKNIPTNRAGLSNTAIFAGAGLLVLLLLGGGFYFYLDSLNQPDLVLSKPAAEISPSITAPAEEATMEAIAPLDDSSLVSPPAEEMASESAKTENVETNNKAPASGTKEQDVIEAPAPRRNLVTRSEQLAFGDPIEASEDAAVKVTRNKPATGINPDLISAYSAFNAGDDVAAQRSYRKVLQGDIRNVDALLGMAAIASRQGRNSDALGWYGKVLEVEPRNTVAQAAMVGVMAEVDPVGSESRIKNLLARQPEAAHLHAALGNLYAEQNQWPLAQQAYFQALHFDSKNAEYAFNLAVSLDHLGKSALALQYYKTALELLSKSGTGNIDRTQVESRIAQLE